MSAKSPFDKVGLLIKLGGNVKNWLERGFALRSSHQVMYYFRSVQDFKVFALDSANNADRIAGTIRLRNATMYVADYVTEYKHVFEISSPPPDQRHYYLATKTRQEMNDWIAKLSAAGVALRVPSPISVLLQLTRSPSAPPSIYGVQGFLEKRGYWNTGYKTRFFRLQANLDGLLVLYYYKRYDDLAPKGSIPLLEAEVMEELEKPSAQKECEFGIKSQGRPYALRASSEELRNEWVTALKTAVRNPKAEAMYLNSKGEFLSADAAAKLHSDSDALVAKKAAAASATVQADAQLLESSGANGTSSSSAAGGGAAAGAGDSAASSDAQASSSNGTGGVAVIDKRKANEILAEAKRKQDEAVRRAKDEKTAKEREEREAREKKEREEAHRLAAERIAEEERRKEEQRLNKLVAVADAGQLFIKFGRKGNPHNKFVFLDGDRVYWCEPAAKGEQQSKEKQAKKFVKLTAATKLIGGKTTDVFKRAVAQREHDEFCFSVIGSDRTLDLVASTKDQRDTWLEALAAAQKKLFGAKK
eukprot:TRINITY_DN67520_c8_g1_i1.p1 TRINITY_DN67520_c8_g1~~TRINITY_DN67520_c8_g1_i1.p1  ORF type:complete len:531 (-),score=291.48 TRINITY_DN67520_c8_g1_i1:663-2255(-)